MGDYYDQPGYYLPGQIGVQKPMIPGGLSINTNELVNTHEKRINAATRFVEVLTDKLADTQSQLYREIGERQALQARVDELEALVKQLAKSQLGLDVD